MLFQKLVPIPMLKNRSIFVSSRRNYFIRKSEMSSKTRQFIYPYEKDQRRENFSIFHLPKTFAFASFFIMFTFGCSPGLQPAVFAALVPNSADKLLREVIDEIIGDHEMLVCYYTFYFHVNTQNLHSCIHVSLHF